MLVSRRLCGFAAPRRCVFAALLWLVSERARFATSSHALRPPGHEPAANGARKTRTREGSDGANLALLLRFTGKNGVRWIVGLCWSVSPTRELMPEALDDAWVPGVVELRARPPRRGLPSVCYVIADVWSSVVVVVCSRFAAWQSQQISGPITVRSRAGSGNASRSPGRASGQPGVADVGIAKISGR